MCTSFVYRKKNIIVAMNFDNNGMPFEVSTKDPKVFSVLVDGGRGKMPSFGVNKEGTFINHLMVDSNGKGSYRRAGRKVTHTTKLVNDILYEIITPNELNEYLNNMEVVNVPDYSVHNMISDKDGNVWIVEPGRKNIFSEFNESPYYVMTNFSLCDYKDKKEVAGDGLDRYEIVNDMLDKDHYLSVSDAFKVLQAVRQNGEWKTALSMVYSHIDKTVYYCYNGNFEEILTYQFS